jgi:hypothetical protein
MDLIRKISQLLGRSQPLMLSEYRKPWHHYFAQNAGEGWVVLGSSNRRKTVDVQIPYLFPSKPVARSVAKYMTRSAMVRTHIMHNESAR